MLMHRFTILSLAGLTSVGCTVSVRPAIPPPPPPTVAVTVGAPPPEQAPPPDQSPPPEAPAAEEAPPPADTYDDQDPTALQDFHPALDAHGTWVDDPVYGTVWIPNPAEVGADFVPYVGAGHWVYDNDDYLWVSDYDWGWAPFHYGRWVVLGSGAWGWIPGREYAPAWVDWRVGDDYVGWAPLGPTFIWRGGVVITAGFPRPEPHYGFVGHGDLFSPTPGRVFIRGERAEAIRARTHAYADGGGHGHRGPSPSSMHIPPSRIAHATGHERGVEQARNFGHPSSAQKMGAHPPAKRVAAAGHDARPGRAEARAGDERKEPGKTAEREPSKTAEKEPSKTAERQPSQAEEHAQGAGNESNRAQPAESARGSSAAGGAHTSAQPQRQASAPKAASKPSSSGGKKK